MKGESSSQVSNKELIEALRRSKLFRNYETVFGKATGLPLTLRPLEYWQLAHRGKKNENHFCALLAEHPETLAVCLEAHEEMIRRTSTLPRTVTCPFGLTETAVPLKLGETTIGFLRVGQVLRRAPSRADTKKVSAAITERGVPFSKDLREAWEQNVLIPPDKYDGIVRLLTFFADQLSALCNQLVIEQKNAEPPIVTRAREYIDKHKSEELNLSAVAAAAGASVFHFCKVFHSATGLKFTDYVARARVEDARERLLNPNMRISEVAYEVGFQSLTQFNRTFKRVFGQSPSEFRARLASPRSRSNNGTARK
ncbi:MAG TPA: helix-turn-helix domain-containing protein [Pyrinomonadaceae bacterium]|nr:helix-turn-helix domain-containing protein [Pyrinomonadaceae bacterium]